MDSKQYNEELFTIAMQAAMQTPALQKRAGKLSDAELLGELAVYGRNEKNASDALVAPAAALAALPAELRNVYTQPHAVLEMNWLPAEDIAAARQYLNNWSERLKVEGEGATAQIRVEPLEALFGKDLPAQEVADWLVLEDDGLFGDLTVYNPNADGPACCRVVSFSNSGSALPVAYRSLRSYMELKWVFGELQNRREALKHATSDPQ